MTASGPTFFLTLCCVLFFIDPFLDKFFFTRRTGVPRVEINRNWGLELAVLHPSRKELSLQFVLDGAAAFYLLWGML